MNGNFYLPYDDSLGDIYTLLMMLFCLCRDYFYERTPMANKRFSGNLSTIKLQRCCRRRFSDIYSAAAKWLRLHGARFEISIKNAASNAGYAAMFTGDTI